MPGVLIVEAIAQAGGLLLLTEVPNRDEMLMVFTGSKKPLPRPVVPGDQLRIEVVVKAWRMTAARLEGKAYVDGKVACEAIVTAASCPSPGRGKAEAASDPE